MLRNYYLHKHKIFMVITEAQLRQLAPFKAQLFKVCTKVCLIVRCPVFPLVEMSF